MNQIFQFIFNCFKSLFNLLDVSFPNSNLTFLDFFLLAIIIPMIFKLVKGAVLNSGEDVIFNTLDLAKDSVSDFKNIQVSNFRKVPIHDSSDGSISNIRVRGKN